MQAYSNSMNVMDLLGSEMENFGRFGPKIETMVYDAGKMKQLFKKLIQNDKFFKKYQIL